MRYYRSSKTDKEYIISGHEDKTARIWDASTGDCVVELTGHNLRVKAMELVASKPDFEEQAVAVLVTVSSDGVIKCWDVEDALEKKPTLLGEYNTKSRATCCTVHLGFSKLSSSTTAADKE